MNLKLMKTLCDLDKDTLKRTLVTYLKKKDYKKVIFKDDYIVAEGELPVCLIAHTDTVFDNDPMQKYIRIPQEELWLYDSEKDILWRAYGAGFDDKSGIYSIIKILEAGYRPHIIFTDFEEVGGVGAQQLVIDYPKLPFSCDFLIELDRRGKNDAVFYDCDNWFFKKYITSFDFKESIGSFSDISFIGPIWDRAAVNLSVGYMDEHSDNERLYCNWCDETIEKVKVILDNLTHTQYVYKKKNHNPTYNFDFNKNF